MTLSIHSPDELIAVIPHMLGFKLFWTTEIEYVRSSTSVVDEVSSAVDDA